jgi:hypothetical protein
MQKQQYLRPHIFIFGKYAMYKKNADEYAMLTSNRKYISAMYYVTLHYRQYLRTTDYILYTIDYHKLVLLKVKVENCKVRPRTVHEGPEAE